MHRNERSLSSREESSSFLCDRSTTRALWGHNKIISPYFACHEALRAEGISLEGPAAQVRNASHTYRRFIVPPMQINLPRGTFLDLDERNTLHKSREITQRSVKSFGSKTVNYL